MHRLLTGGLETGLYVLLIGLCLLHERDEPWTQGAAARHGLWFGVTGLARLDFGIMLGAYLALSWFRGRRRLAEVVVAGAVALAIVSPWLFWVRSTTGSWIPSSGMAQLSAATGWQWLSRISAMLEAVLDYATPWFYVRNQAAARFGVLGFVALVCLWARGRGARVGSREMFSRLADWTIAVAIALGVYVASFEWCYFYYRYAAPVSVSLIPCVSVVLAGGISSLSARGRALIYGAAGLLFAASALYSYHAGTLNGPHATIAHYAVHRVPKGLRLGAFQSGTIGYFRPNVVNLDGKLNHRALRHKRAGTLDVFIEAQKIDVLLDQAWRIDRFIDHAYLKRTFESCAVPVPIQGWRCYRRIAPSSARRSASSS